MFKLAGKDTNTFESLLRAIIPLQVKTDFIVEVNRPYKSLEEAEAEARVCGIGIRIAHGLVLKHVDRCIYGAACARSAGVCRVLSGRIRLCRN